MKIIALLGAGALAVASLAATPADAQRRGWDGYRDGPGWNRGYRGDRWDRGDRRRWRDGRFHRGGYGNRGWRGGYRGRARVICEVQRGYYGPVRRCFRVRR